MIMPCCPRDCNRRWTVGLCSLTRALTWARLMGRSATQTTSSSRSARSIDWTDPSAPLRTAAFRIVELRFNLAFVLYNIRSRDWSMALTAVRPHSHTLHHSDIRQSVPDDG